MKLTGKDLAYWERNQLLLYLTNIFPSWLERHPADHMEWEEDWRNILFVQFPEGLFSWHFHDLDMDYFKHLEFKTGDSWDGTTSEHKYFLLRERTVNYILAGKLPLNNENA